MNNSYSWNNYVLGIGGILTIISWIYMVFFVLDITSSNLLSIIAIFFILIGTPLIIGYLFVDMRNRKLKSLAKEFGLNFEKLAILTGSKEFPINKITGKINGSDVVIEDHQQLYSVPLGHNGGRIASRKTIFLINQVEQKISLSWNGYARINGIRRQLTSTRRSA